MEGTVKEYLEQAKSAVIRVDELKKMINTLSGKITTITKQKENLEKECENLISKTIYQKKKEVEMSYDEILKEVEKRLEVAEKDKEKEKKKNLDMLIEKNTKSVRENNVYLTNEIKKLLDDNKLPGFINSEFYYCFFAPYNMKHYFLNILSAIIILAIPTILSFVVFRKYLIDNKEYFGFFRYVVIGFIYIGVIFLSGSIWLLIDKITNKKPEIISKVRELRKDIEDNEKEIKRISDNTSKKITDDQFDYTKLDREIESTKLEVENKKAQKENAIKNFEETKTQEIRDNIKNQMSKQITECDNTIESTKTELTNIEKEYETLKLKLTDDYNVSIGINNLTEEKLNKYIMLAEQNIDKTLEEILKL